MTDRTARDTPPDYFHAVVQARVYHTIEGAEHLEGQGYTINDPATFDTVVACGWVDVSAVEGSAPPPEGARRT
jgi:hypothetical protein